MNDETAFEADLEIELKIDLKIDLKTGLIELKITAAHVFDEVVDEVSNEVDFNEETVLNEGVNEANAIWMLIITNRDSFDETSDVNDADLIWWSRTCS